MTNNDTLSRDGIGRFLLKSIIAGVVALIGIGGGIYIGIVYAQKYIAQSPELNHTNNSYLIEGNQFPNYSLLDLRTSQTTNINDLASSGSTLLLFLSNSCPHCEEMITFWKTSVIQQLNPDVRVLMIFDDDSFQSPADVQKVFNLTNVDIMITDRDQQFSGDGIFATPTVVGIDSKSKIQFVSSGFDRRLTGSIINDLLMK